MDILIKNLQQGGKKSSGIIEMLSNYGVEFSVLPPVLQQCNVSGSLPPCDHSDWKRWEDEDHAEVTQCQKCGEVWRQ